MAERIVCMLCDTAVAVCVVDPHSGWSALIPQVPIERSSGVGCKASRESARGGKGGGR